MYMSSQPQAYRARRIARVVNTSPETDVYGVRRNRVLGTAALDRLDLFLLFEEFRFGKNASDFSHGPFRGFEILTYMTAGHLCHDDDAGGKNLVEPGGAQWVTAGRGIMQIDVPESGIAHGFQFWLNLPGSEKTQAAAYRPVAAIDIPAVIFPSAEVKVLAGQYYGLMGAIMPPTTRPFIADIILRAEGEVTLDIPDDHDGFVYVYGGGGVAIDQTLVNVGQAGILGKGNLLNLVAGGEGARVLVATARPLKEPVARHGPFVMTTQQDLHEALKDYQNESS